MKSYTQLLHRLKKITKRTWLITGAVALLVCAAGATVLAYAWRQSPNNEVAAVTETQSVLAREPVLKEEPAVDAPATESQPPAAQNTSPSVAPRPPAVAPKATAPSTPRPASPEHPFAVNKVFALAGPYCTGIGNAVMHMRVVSLYTPYPATQPTPINWQIEFMQGGSSRVIATGSHTAQPGVLGHDIPVTSYTADIMTGDDAMRFRVTSPNDIASDWLYAGHDTTCM